MKVKTIGRILLVNINLTYFQVQTKQLVTSSVKLVKFKKSTGQQRTVPGNVFAVWSSKAVKGNKEIQKCELKPLKIFIVCKYHIFETAETKVSSFIFSLRLYFTKCFRT